MAYEEGFTFKDVLRSFVEASDVTPDTTPQDISAPTIPAEPTPPEPAEEQKIVETIEIEITDNNLPSTENEDSTSGEEEIIIETDAEQEFEPEEDDNAVSTDTDNNETSTESEDDTFSQDASVESETPPTTQATPQPDNVPQETSQGMSDSEAELDNPFAKTTGLNETHDEINEQLNKHLSEGNSDIHLSEAELNELKQEAESAEQLDSFRDNVEEKLGNRLIRAGLLTQWQRHVVVNYQRKTYAQNKGISIGEIIVRMGYCTAEQIEQAAMDENLDASLFLPKQKEINHKWMGSRMITAGLITSPQRDRILSEQEIAKENGQQIRFGELAVQLNFCTPTQLQSLIDERTQRLMDSNW